ncbi:MAG: GNAT family N-acetyltransferase [Smithella sp.]
MIANQRFPGRVRPDDKMLAPTLYAYDADEELCRLFERVFGKPMGKTESLRHFKWEYYFNPAGKAIVYVIRNEEGQIVSAYPTMPLKVKFMSGIVRASLSFDSMTLPEYKGRGLFTTLGRALYQYLGKSGYVLTYGFPNGNIQNLRVNQLQWFEVGDFPLLMKVIDCTPLLSRIFPRRVPAKIIGSVVNKIINLFWRNPERKKEDLTVEVLRNFDDEFEDFWKKARSYFSICIERDVIYLRWRYGKPEEEYKILKIAHQGIMVGYAVLKTEMRFNLKTGYIMDFIVCPKNDYINELLSAIVMGFQKEKVDLISALLMKNNPYYKIFRKYGFLLVPRRFHPQEIHFSARINVENRHVIEIRDSRNWFISWGDTDLL